MNIFINKSLWVVRLVIFLLLSGSAFQVVADAESEKETLQALDDAKEAFIKKEYQKLWQEIDTISKWLEANSPRSGLTWEQGEKMIKAWVKKNWRKNVIEIKPMSEGGMEDTVERHQGSFYGWTWDTGEKTVTTDFVFEAKFTALDSKSKVREHKVRFHFEKGTSGWYIKRAGVM